MNGWGRMVFGHVESREERLEHLVRDAGFEPKQRLMDYTLVGEKS